MSAFLFTNMSKPASLQVMVASTYKAVLQKYLDADTKVSFNWVPLTPQILYSQAPMPPLAAMGLAGLLSGTINSYGTQLM